MSVALKTNFLKAVSVEEIKKQYSEKLKDIFSALQLKTAKGSEMIGWIPWVFEDHKWIFDKAKEIRQKWIENKVEVVVIIGTGGSYLGSKACLEFVESNTKKPFEFLFVPYFSSRFLEETINYLRDKKFAIVVISKSGGTLESAVAFRFLRELLFEKEREKHFEYIISITTDGAGSLYELSKKHNYYIFGIEKSIGGRYSTLTPVGLVPAILSGISGEELIAGAKACYEDHYHLEYATNAPFQYAAYRHHFFEKKKLSSECLIAYDPQVNGVLHKMKQLFAESEGKNNKGLMPVILDFTPDLHSVGQMLQEGNTSFFQTIVWVKNEEKKEELKIEESIFGNEDKLDWLKGTDLKELNRAACLGTVNAHRELKNINILLLSVKDWTAFSFGYLYFFLCLAAMFSAYLFEQNPFDQPGVEAYKSRMIENLKKQSS